MGCKRAVEMTRDELINFIKENYPELNNPRPKNAPKLLTKEQKEQELQWKDWQADMLDYVEALNWDQLKRSRNE